ncbi:class Ib ribonucleoside-diphosphate reductase assembly flavoprotein NrdI [Tersicoccus sp. MR15.9]|uniref:class Ib ribonucleoside-diphosphate reductase assembly flavoprotein NrdI n=1 Tax=Tersicoccus mangrovi TaxID=3121635 RepID=UPI002FE63CC1
MHIVYFSSVSANTHRFVTKLGLPADRLPLHTRQDTVLATEPYVLITPTYGDGQGSGAVPKQVIKFLNVPGNRALIAGVIGTGNTNFGQTYCLAGAVVAAKCRTQLLHRVELMGTVDDVDRVREGMESL